MELLRDRPAVLRAEGGGLEDEQVKRALREVEAFVGHESSCTSTGEYVATCRSASGMTAAQADGRRVSPVGAVAANVGGRRAGDACSNAYASLSSVASLHAVPTNDKPTGNPRTIPIGTVMCG